jgi:hypothetical protein
MNAAMTNTVGYYNGNKWPIHLVISELNVTLRLSPGEYILDSSGRKINDAFFDKYTKPLQLSKELSKNGPVVLLAVPKVTSAAHNHSHQHPVRAVTSFTEDANGRRVPALPAPAPVAPNLAVNTPTHKGMSMEEARRLGLIGKPRVVPEDYGVTDTDGRPVDVSKAPPIKYAIESTPRVRTDGALPAELTQMDEKLDPTQAAARAQLVGGLQKAAASNVESATGFMNQVEQNQPPQVASPLGQPVQPVQVAQPVEESAIDEALPAPNIFAANQVTASAPATRAPDVLAQAKANAKKAIAKGDPKPATPKNNKPFVCNVDGEGFRYRSELERYAKRKFPDRIADILAPYPAA